MLCHERWNHYRRTIYSECMVKKLARFQRSRNSLISREQRLDHSLYSPISRGFDGDAGNRAARYPAR